MKSLRIGLLVACVLMAGLPQAQAQKPQAPHAAVAARPAAKAAALQPTAVRELGGIEEYRLPNGLQVLLFPDATQTTTTVNITYRVGSRYEAPGEYGMAHLLEHMLFKGTPQHRDIPGAMAQRGVRFNGTTTVDRTNYFASFNANADTLAFLLGLEADRMVNSRVAKADLDTEMTVVRNEFERGENQPFAVLAQRVNAAAYAWHPYGHATIGPKSDIENLPIEKLQGFYRRYYRPDNATLLIAGAFDKAATLALIARDFGPVAKPAAPIPQPYTVEPAQDGERSVVVRRVGGQPLLLAVYHVPAITHPDTPALIVYGLLMSLQPSGQLYKQLVEPKLAVAAGIGGVGGTDPGTVSAYAALPPDADVGKVEAQLLDLVEGRTAKPFEESELVRVRDIAVNSYRQQMKNPEALIQQISGLIAAGDWRLLFQLMEDIPKVTLADVERVRAAYFRPANRTLGRYLPAAAVERVEIPAAPALDERLAGLKAPPKVEAGEQLDPVPAVLESRMNRTTLPSGIALHTLRKQTRGNSVALMLGLRWGERDATFARNGTGMVGSLMNEGSAGYSKQQLQDALIKLRASLNISSYDQGATVFLSAERDTLLPALRVVADVLRHPLLPQDAFDRDIKAGLAAIEASRQEPGVLRQEATRGHYNQARGVHLGQPDYVMGVDERIANLKATTLDDVRRFHADYWSANDAQVSVVGALPDGLAAEVDKLFGDWKKPAAPKFLRHIPRHVEVPPARFDAIARDKANAIVRLHETLALNSEDADNAALELAVHVFGGGGLESRLSERVRQKEGLTYGIAASLTAGFWGNDGGFAIQASYAPDKRERVIAVIREELARMTADGITAAELARAKQDMLESRKQARTEIGALAGTLGSLAERAQTWAAVQKDDDEIAAVTVEQVNAAWRAHIRPDAFVISTAGDFKNP
ncbi:M16 family metallopeptidase [Roseateles saccharophilus]|uniref:Zinc protease n=1 Tax=Roseateles saccharophilus TaxID=304 RepID=A0A4R3UGB4_ROSSA|nr:pitrilysin family protein [Roseateles saccharophilus]MDG0834434.1 insulinase family protein [Roseateles saccharophilus]TCU89854.1 zinc protease [Roseateles saccharophilus]